MSNKEPSHISALATKYQRCCQYRRICANQQRKKAVSFDIPLDETKTTGAMLLDQRVTIDYNARDFGFVESVPTELKSDLLKKVVQIDNSIEKYH